MLFLVLLYGAYAALVHKPLTRVLAERRSRTEGAIERARADIAAPRARTEYEQRLRMRVAVFKSQEARRQQALQARAAAVAQAGGKAQAQVEQARAIETEKTAAQAGLQAESRTLAEKSSARFCNRQWQVVADETSSSAEKNTHAQPKSPAFFFCCRYIWASYLVCTGGPRRGSGQAVVPALGPALKPTAFFRPAIGEGNARSCG